MSRCQGDFHVTRIDNPYSYETFVVKNPVKRPPKCIPPTFPEHSSVSLHLQERLSVRLIIFIALRFHLLLRFLVQGTGKISTRMRSEREIKIAKNLKWNKTPTSENAWRGYTKFAQRNKMYRTQYFVLSSYWRFAVNHMACACRISPARLAETN